MQNRLLIFSIFLLLSRTIYASDTIAIYNNIIRETPSDWNARFEIAKLYFDSHDFSAAEYNFEFARADNSLSENTINEIDQYLTKIREQTRWDIEFGIGAIPDASINYTPSNRHECVNGARGPICYEIPDPTSGIGFQINGAANYYKQVYKNYGLRTTIGGAILNTSDNIPTDYSAHFAIGPRYVFSRGDISIQPSFGARMYNNTFYNFSYGVRINSNLQIPGNLFSNIGLDIQHSHYHNKEINNALHGHDWTFYIHPKYYINDISFISLTGALSHNHTELSSLGSNTGRIALGYFHIFPYGFNFYINAMYSFSEYHAADTQISPTTHPTIRHDHIYQFYTRLYNSYIELHNFIPAIGYTYTIQDSNISQYAQSNHQVMIEIVRQF